MFIRVIAGRERADPVFTSSFELFGGQKLYVNVILKVDIGP